MKITKYGHACVVLQEQGKKLVIDPGSWTEGLGSLDAIAAVVITHNHGDHLRIEHLNAIVQQNPGVQIFGPQEVVNDAAKNNIQVNKVISGFTATVGPFTIRFYGDMHAVIHQSFPPVPHNVGVLVNDTFYYPGDSFTVPDGAPVKTLAVPASAPWMKIAEAVDFIAMVQPQVCFSTHNALLSDIGQQLTDSWFKRTCDTLHAEYYSLKPGESFNA
jgi:L-ascorbate metabolism protein UlaG (beta-lactamase superfamily)